MKVVMNAIPLLSPLTGIGNYIYLLITEMKRLRPEDQYTYYYGFYTKKIKLYNDLFYRVKELIKKIPILSDAARNFKNNVAGHQFSQYDIYFEPNYIPVNIKARKIVTTVYDFSFIHHPEWHPKDRIDYFNKNFFQNIGRSDTIITISNYIKEEAKSFLKSDDSRIVSIPICYDPIFSNAIEQVDQAKTKVTLPENYILYVGSIEPRKNLLNLLKAYKRLPDNIKKEYKLLFAGFLGWQNKEIVKLLEEMNDNVIYLGYVENETLVDLYHNAACFVYPSLYEGFGLPPLEAMACGCPAIVSNAASIPEVCGDAALYIDPFDVDSIADGIEKVITDTAIRDDLIKKGLERVKLYSWEKTAQEHIKLFEDLLTI